MITVRVELLMYKIEKEVKQRLKEKKGCKKRLKRALERGLIKILYRISDNKLKVKHYQNHSEFGCDEFGRDVKDGLRRYVEILKLRGLAVNTVVLLGSRAKGSWTPQSDVDVVIIADNLPKERRNPLAKRLSDLRKSLVLSDRPLYLGIEPSGCCSRVEFLERLERFDIQVLDAIFYGRVIYDDGFWLQVMENFKRINGTYKLPIKKLKRILQPL
jgi:predicted nucleotidyltransferase